MGAADDATLVAQAHEGNREALGQLLSRHERVMVAIARAYFASEADAEDAVQEAAATVCHALGQLRDAARFAGWMVTITRNTGLQILRTQKDKLSLADFASSAQFQRRVGSTPATPATMASLHENSDLLWVAIGRLAEDHRVALMLRYTEDMAYEQIGAYLDVPLSTVKSRLRNAKRALEGMLDTLRPPEG